jgi:hypothetical protein
MASTYLVLVRRPHRLDDLLRLGLRDPTLLRDELRENSVDLARHVGRISADIDVRLLEEKLVDLIRAGLDTVLYVDLLVSLAGEGNVQVELVAEDLLVFLYSFALDTSLLVVWSIKGLENNIPPTRPHT